MKTIGIDLVVIFVVFFACAIVSYLTNPIVGVLILAMTVGVWELLSRFLSPREKTQRAINR